MTPPTEPPADPVQLRDLQAQVQRKQVQTQQEQAQRAQATVSQLVSRLGLRLSIPVVQAPMAGVSTPELAAAVSNAGGLGSLAAGYQTAQVLSSQLARTHALTTQPFAVNLFAPLPRVAVDRRTWLAARAALAPAYSELGLTLPDEPPAAQTDFVGQLDAVLAQPPAAVSLTFGLPEPAVVGALKRAGCRVFITVTSRSEAELARTAGADALVAQGRAAGGHRGGWMSDSLAPTLALVRGVTGLGLPVMAAGGLMTPADVSEALEAGATAAQCGTAFLLAREAGTSAPYRAALAATSEQPHPVTVLTKGPSGRWARGLPNRLSAIAETQALPYPLQHVLTMPVRSAAAERNRRDWLSLWAGEGVGRLRGDVPAAELTRWLGRGCTAGAADLRPGHLD